MLAVLSLPAEPFFFFCMECFFFVWSELYMLFDVHLWVLSFNTQRKASPCHLPGVMAGISQLANTWSSAGCGLMHLASTACTAQLEITLRNATERPQLRTVVAFLKVISNCAVHAVDAKCINCVHTACSVGDVPFFSGRAAAFRRARSSMHARKQAVLLLKSMGTCERTLLGCFSLSGFHGWAIALPSFFSLLVAWELWNQWCRYRCLCHWQHVWYIPVCAHCLKIWCVLVPQIPGLFIAMVYLERLFTWLTLN